MSTKPAEKKPRQTKQRTLVSAAMADASDFMTAQQVHANLRQAGESIGLATVYRNLQAMADADEVDAIRNPDGEVAYRRCSPVHHHHLICRFCGTAVEITGDGLEEWAEQVAEDNGFHSPDHHVEISGICANCWAAGKR